MESSRRKVLFEEAKNFLEMQGGISPEWQEEFDQLTQSDRIDELDIIVGHMCMSENGGTGSTREFLEMIGAKPSEIDQLIADNCDMYF